MFKAVSEVGVWRNSASLVHWSSIFYRLGLCAVCTCSALGTVDGRRGRERDGYERVRKRERESERGGGEGKTEG